MEAAGIAPASGETQIPLQLCPYGKHGCFWLETGWEPSASGDASGHPVTLPPELRQVIEAWAFLPREVVRAMLALVQSAPESPG
jgi:hypothetical protein